MNIFPFKSAYAQPTASTVVDKAIEAYGGDAYKDAHFQYDFRDHHYTYHFDNGVYRYERYNTKTKTKDVMHNDGSERWVNGSLVDIDAKLAAKYASSVNSVHYFAFLPYFLNDGAVNKKLLGKVTIKGKDYFKVQVTFDQEGGGEDYDDIYVYWFDTKTYHLDYLAYSFHVNGGGVRFRSAYNQRVIGGITFQDYVNYKHGKNTLVSDMDSLYESGDLTELSKIELTNIKPVKK